jgi:hypothetical protein
VDLSAPSKALRFRTSHHSSSLIAAPPLAPAIAGTHKAPTVNNRRGEVSAKKDPRPDGRGSLDSQ